MTDTRPASQKVFAAEARELRLFVVAGEHSGDALGAKLMAALDQGRGGRIRYLGVGGPDMAAAGLSSHFPIEEVAVMGPASASQADLERLALAKLKARLAREG